MKELSNKGFQIVPYFVGYKTDMWKRGSQKGGKMLELSRRQQGGAQEASPPNSWERRNGRKKDLISAAHGTQD